MPHRTASLLYALCAFCLAITARAGGSGEQVAVVINGDSWASIAVANAFVELRQVPPANVIWLRGIPSPEVVDVAVFRETMLKPVLAALDEHGLRQQITTIAWSCDLPWGIDLKPDQAGANPPATTGSRGALTGLTYLYEMVLAGDAAAYTRFDTNWFCRAPQRRQAAPRKVQEPSPQQIAVLQQAGQAIQAKEVEQAAKLYTDLLAEWELDVAAYNLACCHALLGKPDEAMAALQRAVKAGWRDVDHTLGDPDLTTLREREDFQQLIKEMKSAGETLALPPTAAFDAAIGWDRQGQRTGAKDARRYLMSVQLAVTSGRGLSVDEAIAGLERSAAADRTRPDGTIVFMRNGDVRSKTRQWGFAPAEALLTELGMKAAIVEGHLPKDMPAIAGLMIGSAGFDWAKSGNTLLPGAIAEHLTSFGAELHATSGQTPLTELLRHGAAGASGTVTEPYAIQAKFPTPFIQVHYARGATLAEAFYQSVQAPYQLLIMGDPLCQPWAPSLDFTLEPNGTTLRARAADPVAIEAFELYLDGKLAERAYPGQSFRLADQPGYREARVVAIGRDRMAARFARDLLWPPVELPAPIDLARTESLLLAAPAGLPDGFRVGFLGQSLPVVRDGDHLRIDCQSLPAGRVTLRLVDRDSRLLAPPIALNVTAPDAMLPAEVDAAALKPSVLLTRQDGSQWTFREARPDWLAKAGIPDGEGFTLEGCLPGTETPTAQHQLVYRTNRPATLTIGSQTIALTADNQWHYLPLYLAPGWHRLQADIAPGQGKPNVDLRVGCRGAQAIQRAAHHLPTKDEQLADPPPPPKEPEKQPEEEPKPEAPKPEARPAE